MSKTIWFVNHYSPPIEYYPHERTYHYAHRMQTLENKVYIFCASAVHNTEINLIESKQSFKQLSSNNVNYVILKTPNYRGNGISRILNMLEFSRKFLVNYKKIPKPDLIIATSVHPFACYTAIKIAKKLGIKCIIEIADLWPESIVAYGIASKNNLFVKFLYALERYIYIKSSAIIFTMKGGIDYVKKQKKIFKNITLDNIYTINNGVDLDKFDNNSRNYFYSNDEYNDSNIFRVVYTGSLGQANQIELILDAARIIDKKDSNIKFYIFGNGSNMGKIKEYITGRNISNVVLPGKVDKKYIPSILKKSHVNVIIIKESTLLQYGVSPNKLFEYAASSKPILVNTESAYDLVKEFNCGVISKENTAQSIVESILEIKSLDQANYTIMCQNARTMAEHYDYKNTSKKFSEIITKYLA